MNPVSYGELLMPPPSERDEAAAEMPTIANADLWVVTREGIYFAPYMDPRRLRYYDFATKNVREVFVPARDFSVQIPLKAIEQ
jgi:hypothetical protein